jgi:hypothetical protein
LKVPVEIVGTRDQHMGPRWEFAKIRLSVEPADIFDVQIGPLPKAADLEKKGYLDAAIMGLLDVLLTTESLPLRDIRVTFIEAEEHPVDSSQMAFRHAGRDAARNLLQAVNEHAFAPPR